MHQGQGARGQIGQTTNRWRNARFLTRVVEDVLGRGRWAHNVVLRNRRTVSQMREEITAEQRLAVLFVDYPSIPTVRHMGRISAISLSDTRHPVIRVWGSGRITAKRPNPPQIR